jgi:DNA polymerase III alpha subunit
VVLAAQKPGVFIGEISVLTGAPHMAACETTESSRIFKFEPSLFKEALAGVSRILAKDLDQYVGKEVTLIGWLLTEKIVSTKKGEPMEFMTLEDQTGMYDATVFPNTYRTYCHLLATNQAYVVTGLVEEHFSTVTATVKTLQLLTTGGIPASSEPLEELSV